MANRFADGETELRRHQWGELVGERLGNIRDRAPVATDELERELLEALKTPPDGEAFRDLGRTQPFVRQAFALNMGGVLVQPSAQDASREELDFLKRTAPIWNRRSVLPTLQRRAQPRAPISSRKIPLKRWARIGRLATIFSLWPQSSGAAG